MSSKNIQQARIQMYLNQVCTTRNTNSIKAYQAMKQSDYLNPKNKSNE